MSRKNLSFEQAVEQLETLIEQIDSGETGLEEAIRQYEQGAALVQHCRSILDRAERRIAELTERGTGHLAIDGEDTHAAWPSVTADPGKEPS